MKKQNKKTTTNIWHLSDFTYISYFNSAHLQEYKDTAKLMSQQSETEE